MVKTWKLFLKSIAMCMTHREMEDEEEQPIAR
jgi:hypothetical protein